MVNPSLQSGNCYSVFAKPFLGVGRACSTLRVYSSAKYAVFMSMISLIHYQLTHCFWF